MVPKTPEKKEIPEINKIILSDPVIPIDIFVQLRAANLLGHILRADENDPLKKATISEDGLSPNVWETNRVGRPYILWFEDTAKFVWTHLSDLTGNIDVNFKVKSKEHNFTLLNLALRRLF